MQLNSSHKIIMANAKFSIDQKPTSTDLALSERDFHVAMGEIEADRGLYIENIPLDITSFGSRHSVTHDHWVIITNDLGNAGHVKFRGPGVWHWETALIGQNASGQHVCLYDAATALIEAARAILGRSKSPERKLSERLTSDGAKLMGVVRNTEETCNFMKSEGFEEIDLSDLKPLDGWVSGVLGCKEGDDGTKLAVLGGQIGEICEVEFTFDKDGILDTRIICIHGPDLSESEERVHEYLSSLERKATARKYTGRKVEWNDSRKVSEIMDLIAKNTGSLKMNSGGYSQMRDRVFRVGSMPVIKFGLLDDPRYGGERYSKIVHDEAVERAVSEDRKDGVSIIRVRRKTGCWWALKTTGKNSYEHVANIVKAAGNDRWNVKWKGGATHKQVFNGLDEACGYIETFLNQSTEAHI